MNYVGIDIAKLKHFATCVSKYGEVLIKPFEFLNDNDGFTLLSSKLNDLEDKDVIIGLVRRHIMETTYYDTLFPTTIKCVF